MLERLDLGTDPGDGPSIEPERVGLIRLPSPVLQVSLTGRYNALAGDNPPSHHVHGIGFQDPYVVPDRLFRGLLALDLLRLRIPLRVLVNSPASLSPVKVGFS